MARGIEKAAADAMKNIQACRSAAVMLKGEVERLAWTAVPAGQRRDTLLQIGERAASTLHMCNQSEEDLAKLVQAIRKEEATAGTKT